MKKILGLVIIIVALVLASYYAMGYITQRALKHDFALINKTTSITLKVKTYKLGLFTSKAIIQAKLHVPERKVTDSTGQTTILAAKDNDLDIPLKIYHGPIIFTDSTVKFGFGFATTTISLPTDLNERFNNSFTPDSTKPLLQLALFVNYLKHTYFDVDVPQFILKAKQGNNQFEWLGFKSTMKFSRKLKDIDGNFKFTGANVLKDQIKTYFGQITSNYNLNQHPLDLYVGKGDLDFKSFQVTTSDNKKVLELDKFQLEFGSDITNDLFNSYTNIYFEKFINDDKEFGPGHLDTTIKNLDAQTLAALNQQLNKIQQSDTAKQQFILTILPELPKLFSHGAQLDIERLDLNMPEGKLDGNLQIVAPNSNINNPFQLLQSLQGKAHLKIPAQLVKNLIVAAVKRNLQASTNLSQAVAQQLKNNASNKSTPNVTPPAPADLDKMAAMQTDQKLQTMQTSGLLVVQDNFYIIDVILKNGQFTINGNPFNAAMMNF